MLFLKTVSITGSLKSSWPKTGEKKSLRNNLACQKNVLAQWQAQEEKPDFPWVLREFLIQTGSVFLVHPHPDPLKLMEVYRASVLLSAKEYFKEKEFTYIYPRSSHFTTSIPFTKTNFTLSLKQFNLDSLCTKKCHFFSFGTPFFIFHQVQG